MIMRIGSPTYIVHEMTDGTGVRDQHEVPGYQVRPLGLSGASGLLHMRVVDLGAEATARARADAARCPLCRGTHDTAA
jgi:hypothetical protein